MIAVLGATGMRLSELAGIRYDPVDPGRSDLDPWNREITVHGKGRKTRTVKISHDASRALDRYIRARAPTPRLTGRICGSGSITAAR
jgi:site-specific recombinase XerD